MSKKCNKCNTDKPLEDFYNHAGYTCKICHKRLLKERKDKDPERFKRMAAIRRKRAHKKRIEYQRKYRENNKEAYNGYSKKSRAKITNGYINSLSRGKKTPIDIESHKVKILIHRINKILIDNSKEKLCSGCNTVKPLSEFQIRRWEWKGVIKERHFCKCYECMRKDDMIRYYKRKNKKNEQLKKQN